MGKEEMALMGKIDSLNAKYAYIHQEMERIEWANNLFDLPKMEEKDIKREAVSNYHNYHNYLTKM